MSGLLRSLTETERYYLSPFFQIETIIEAQIFENKVPFWLRKQMCAVVIGRRIYFRKGAYEANTKAGIGLLAHELTHVEQFLSGMTIAKYLWASGRGYRNNPYEIEAYAKADRVTQTLLLRYPTHFS